MTVIFAVTIDASRWRVDVYLIDMAADTVECVMRTGQRKTRLGLVIVSDVSPLGFAMTVRANLAKVAQMLIVFDMA
jgi:hypothetical protein